MVDAEGGAALDPGFGYGGGGGGGGRHIDNECMQSQGWILKAEKGGGVCVLSASRPMRKAGGGGGVERGVLSASGPIRKVGGCLPYDDLYLCACMRDSAWGMERGGGGRQLVAESGISYE